MKRRRIGRSALAVSEICLGTMTFGSTCDEPLALRILDRAFDRGIDFFDTAEIYPVPPDAKWVHRSEEIFGKWLRTKPRDAIFVATKFCGPGHGWFIPPVREGRTALDRHHIRRAIEGSLRRLGVDYIDLYQTHWPDHDFPYEPTLEALAEQVRAGVVRTITVRAVRASWRRPAKGDGEAVLEREELGDRPGTWGYRRRSRLEAGRVGAGLEQTPRLRRVDDRRREQRRAA
jgi:aryl-alcohol dehydrogenase-like predicted oxidoreductase